MTESERALAHLASTGISAHEVEVEWAWGFFEDGLGSKLCVSGDVAFYRQKTYGGFVLVRPKPEAWEVVRG